MSACYAPRFEEYLKLTKSEGMSKEESPTGSGSQVQSCSEDSFLGLLRYLEGKVRDLQDVLSELEQKSITIPSKKYIPAIILEKSHTTVTSSIQEGAECLKKLHVMFTCEELSRRTDDISHAETEWRRIESFLDVVFPESIREVKDLTADSSESFFIEAKNLLHKLLCRITKETIPPRINDHLDGFRLGQPLDFHQIFKDELPELQDRKAFLRYIKQYPMFVDGVVDTDTGLIYAAKPTRREKATTIVVISVPLIFGFVLARYLMPNLGVWLNLQGWVPNPSSSTALLASYLFILLGGLTHVVVDSRKKKMATKGDAFVSFEDYLLWVHVKRTAIMGAIVSLIIGFIALAFLEPSIQWQIAFFVGYSIDSFVDVFLQRFTDVLPSTTSVMKQIGI